jgi:hypothetical protein
LWPTLKRRSSGVTCEAMWFAKRNAGQIPLRLRRRLKHVRDPERISIAGVCLCLQI